MVHERWTGAGDGAGNELKEEPLNKGSTRAPSSRPGDAGVVLRPPQVQPLSNEQRDEAIALLSDLLLAAARRCTGDRAIIGDTEDRGQELAA